MRLRRSIALILLLPVACSTPEGSVVVQEAPPPITTADPYSTAGEFALPKASPQEHPDLHNVYHLSSRIVSGSEPHGEAAFDLLARMGVKTILSVDGKVPDAETAERYGMRYVHVPIEYKGITDDQTLAIAKTFRELDGPFYVHCFHGKHRGPAAAAIGRLVLDGISREQAIAEMRQWCGTSPDYAGLYRTIASQHVPSTTETESCAFDFPSAKPLEGLPDAMVEVSRPFDHLKDLSTRSWASDPSHPDVDAGNEARKLLDAFRRAATMEEAHGKPDDFQRWLAASIAAAERLSTSLTGLNGMAASEGSEQLASSVASFKELTANCKACHAIYRDE